jgi:hypothetical protein
MFETISRFNVACAPVSCTAYPAALVAMCEARSGLTHIATTPFWGMRTSNICPVSQQLTETGTANSINYFLSRVGGLATGGVMPDDRLE